MRSGPKFKKFGKKKVAAAIRGSSLLLDYGLVADRRDSNGFFLYAPLKPTTTIDFIKKQTEQTS